ncbi:MAG: rhodanese-like domain-containing protein [Holophagaceae bacterium]|nr:rhodanese-like domain-containing protein [Holophagaceae bacterium]
MELPAYLALALVCAWFANTLAGPARRLSWRLRQPTAPAISSLPAPSAALPLPLPAIAPPKTAQPADLVAHPMSAAKPAALGSTSPSDPKTEVMARFPPLVNEAQAAISGDEAVWLHAHGALFLDARRTAMYEAGHIPGSKNVSAWEDGLAEKVDQLSLFTRDLKMPVVVYCSGGDCHDSHLVAQKLWLAGFRNLRIYTDGYPDWEARNLPLAKGDQP